MSGMNYDWVMGFGFGWIVGVIVLVVIVLLMFGALIKKRYPHKRYKLPLESLKKRYAGGEIDKQELEENNKDM